MAGIVRRILGAKVSAADLARAIEVIDELSPEDRTDIAARVVCLIEAFGQPGRHEVSARVAAIDWRLQALARLSGRPEFRNWPMPGNDGFGKIAANVLEAAAIEPLIEHEGEPAFDPESFLERLMAMTEEKVMADASLPAIVERAASVRTPAMRSALAVPAVIADAGDHAARRFLEFFAASIRNRNTRMAYYRAVCSFFAWVERHRIGELADIEPLHVAAYIEALQATAAKPTVKQHLAAIRMLFDWLVIGQLLAVNPAHAVRGPKHVVRRGKTPVLTEDQARRLLDSLDTSTLVGLRDRALIGVMVYTFARIGAVVALRVEDYYPAGKRWWLRLHEKGGKRHDMPVHHKLEQFLDEYLDVAGIRDAGKTPLFRSAAGKTGRLTENPLHRIDAYQMIRRRTAEAGFKIKLGCHVFRATGITAYLEAGGTLENAQAMAAHESPRTTKLYDRTGDEITLDEVERITI